jgi:hypothetical protein
VYTPVVVRFSDPQVIGHSCSKSSHIDARWHGTSSESNKPVIVGSTEVFRRDY